MRQIVPNHKAKPADRPEITPVDRLLDLFGSARVGAIAGLTTDAIRKWNRRRSTGGKGGLVPSDLQARYLAAAAAEGKPLTAADLIAEPWE